MPFTPTEREGAVTFDVLVSPRAGHERIGPVVDDRLKVAVTAPPADGEAAGSQVTAAASGPAADAAAADDAGVTGSRSED